MDKRTAPNFIEIFKDFILVLGTQTHIQKRYAVNDSWLSRINTQKKPIGLLLF